MQIAQGQWSKHLAAASLKPVYLLAGAELLVLEAADALRARARELGYDEREVLDVQPRFDWNQLAQAGAGLSLFARRRVIDLRLPTGRPGRDGSAAISEWCKDPPPDTLLMITCSEWSKKHEGAWSRAVEKVGAIVAVPAPRYHEWPAWLAARLAARGIDATPDAVAVLAERVEGNLLAAAQEIDKLAIVHTGGHLDAATLKAMVVDSSRYDVFKLTDAAFGGDAARTIHIIEGLEAEGDDLLALMGWLIAQLELAARLASARDFAAQARTEHLWPTRQQLFASALRRAPPRHWRQCLVRAARIDRMVKGREAGNPWREAQRLVVSMARARPGRTGA